MFLLVHVLVFVVPSVLVCLYVFVDMCVSVCVRVTCGHVFFFKLSQLQYGKSFWFPEIALPSSGTNFAGHPCPIEVPEPTYW